MIRVLIRLFYKLKRAANSKLDTHIGAEIEPLKKEYIKVEGEKHNLYQRVDDECVVYNLTVPGVMRDLGKEGIMGTLFFAAVFLYSTYKFAGEDLYEGSALLIWFVIFLVCISVTVFCFWYEENGPRKFITLDRKQGLMTFPRQVSFEHHTAPFDRIQGLWVGTGANSSALAMHLVVKDLDSKKGSSFLDGHMTWYSRNWSFYVWYMDKNRPLPSGDAFDAYRDKDFERRKAEGFPPPLYTSSYATPEATPEQQTEREQYWKDEDYILEIIMEEGGVKYDPEVHLGWNAVTRYNDAERTSPSANTWYKYDFPNGDKVYMKTDEQGRGYSPPSSVEFKMTFYE
jgi:hypothetical protein